MKKGIRKLFGYVSGCGGFGLYEVIGIAAVLIVAAFVVIPGFRTFAQTIMNEMNDWVDSSIFGRIFPAS